MQIAGFQNLGHCLYPIRLEANEDFQSFDFLLRPRLSIYAMNLDV